MVDLVFEVERRLGQMTELAPITGPLAYSPFERLVHRFGELSRGGVLVKGTTRLRLEDGQDIVGRQILFDFRLLVRG